jgi:hypothetical protein
MKKISKFGFTFIMAFLLMGESYGTSFLKEGAFLGKFNDNEESVFYLRSIKGREGSFFGLIITDTAAVKLFIIDEDKSGNFYTMTSIKGNDQGEISKAFDRPTFSIVSSANKMIVITAADSANSKELGFYSFKLKSIDRKWDDGMTGNFSRIDHKKTAVISSFSVDQQEATMLFTNSGESNGSYSIALKYPGIFMVNAKKYSSGGERKVERPYGLAVFIRDNRFLVGSKMMYIVEGSDETKFGIYKKKD